MLALPQPYEDFAHTADLGLRARGATPEEALGRLALALSSVLTGGAPAGAGREERLTTVGGPDLAGSAVGLLRELLFRAATAREVAAAIDVERVDARGATALVAFAPYDPERGEGTDVKAVTWHAARLEREGAGWMAQVVLDV